MKKFLFIFLFCLPLCFKFDCFASLPKVYSEAYEISHFVYLDINGQYVCVDMPSGTTWSANASRGTVAFSNPITLYVFNSSYNYVANYYLDDGYISSGYVRTIKELSWSSYERNFYWDYFWIDVGYVWASEWLFDDDGDFFKPNFDPYVYVQTNPWNEAMKVFNMENTPSNLNHIDIILDGVVIGSFNYDHETYSQQGGYFRIDKTKIGSNGYVDLEFKPYWNNGNFGDSQVVSVNMRPNLEFFQTAKVQKYVSPNTGKEYRYLGTTNTKTNFVNPSTNVPTPTSHVCNPGVLVSTPIGEDPTGNELPPDSPSTPEPDPDDPIPNPDPTPGQPTPPSGSVTPTPPPSGGLPKPTPSDPDPKPDVEIGISFDFGDLWGSWHKIKAKLDEGFTMFDGLVERLSLFGIPSEIVVSLLLVFTFILLCAFIKLSLVIIKLILDIIPF